MGRIHSATNGRTEPFVIRLSIQAFSAVGKLIYLLDEN